MEIKKKEIKFQAPRILIYGENGLGKSTWASKAKNPLFLDIEKNIHHLSGFDFADINSYEDLKKGLNEILYSDDFQFNTIVVDSITRLEKLIEIYTCNKLKINDISQAQYGKGTSFARKAFDELLDILESINIRKNISIIFIGHAAKENFTSYTHNFTSDKYSLRLDERMRSSLFSRVNCIFLLSHDFDVQEKKDIRQKDEPIIFTQGNHLFMAKNTFNLPLKMPRDYQFFRNKMEEYFNLKKQISEKNKENIIEEEKEEVNLDILNAG